MRRLLIFASTLIFATTACAQILGVDGDYDLTHSSTATGLGAGTGGTSSGGEASESTVSGSGGVDNPSNAGGSNAGGSDAGGSAECLDNGALKFAGAHHVVGVQPQVFALGANDEITVEAWIYPFKQGDPNTTGGAEKHIVSHNNGATRNPPNVGYMLTTQNGEVAFRYWDGNGVKVEVKTSPANNASTLTQNEWHHVAATYDKNFLHIRVFVNGVREGAGAPGPPINCDPCWLTIGADAKASYDSTFEGLIDEVRISSIARYSLNFTGSLPTAQFDPDGDTVALWHFNETSGPDANDAAGKPENNHDGALGALAIAATAKKPERICVSAIADMIP